MPMDARLLAWAREATSRRGGRTGRQVPPLWLFTDAARLPDPRPAVARLPKGLAGVVLRHDGVADRTVLGRDLIRICRARRLAMVVAGDGRLAVALGAGVHLRAGRWPDSVRPHGRLVTSSAHNRMELIRARHAGADLVFLSPAYPTLSHPEAAALGPVRWSALACHAAVAVAALGGIDARSVRRLARRLCRGAAAIGALV